MDAKAIQQLDAEIGEELDATRRRWSDGTYTDEELIRRALRALAFEEERTAKLYGAHGEFAEQAAACRKTAEHAERLADALICNLRLARRRKPR